MTNAILGTRRLFEGWFSLLMLRMRLNGQEIDRALVVHPTGSAILAYDPERRVAMTIREARAAVLYCDASTLVEAVAGVSEAGDYAETARREALEEAGLRLRELEPVAAVWMTPSSTTERVHLFLAAYTPADRVAEGGGLEEENERLLVRELPLVELWQMLTSGELADAKTLLLLQALRIRRPELFEE